METITRREEQIMLAILSLKEDAYLVAIIRHLTELMGKNWSIGSIHIPLRRLEEAELIESSFGEATAVRGGRRKKIYRLTKNGLTALAENKRINDLLWQSFPELEVK